jgi:hypothetical protein
VAEDELLSATLPPGEATQPPKAKPAISKADRRWSGANPAKS